MSEEINLSQLSCPGATNEEFRDVPQADDMQHSRIVRVLCFPWVLVRSRAASRTGDAIRMSDMGKQICEMFSWFGPLPPLDALKRLFFSGISFNHDYG
jgi:hypothetical protein